MMQQRQSCSLKKQRKVQMHLGQMEYPQEEMVLLSGKDGKLVPVEDLAENAAVLAQMQSFRFIR